VQGPNWLTFTCTKPYQLPDDIRFEEREASCLDCEDYRIRVNSEQGTFIDYCESGNKDESAQNIVPCEDFKEIE
jgi:hypothetical protein